MHTLPAPLVGVFASNRAVIELNAVNRVCAMPQAHCSLPRSDARVQMHGQVQTSRHRRPTGLEMSGFGRDLNRYFSLTTPTTCGKEVKSQKILMAEYYQRCPHTVAMSPFFTRLSQHIATLPCTQCLLPDLRAFPATQEA